MSADEINLPADPDAFRALFAHIQPSMEASEQALEAERTAHEANRNAVKLTALQIEKLKAELSRLRRISDRGAVALVFCNLRKCGHIEYGKSRDRGVGAQRSYGIGELA